MEEESAEVHEDFTAYRKGKVEETQKLVAGARKVSGVYQDLLMSVGEETDVPKDIQVSNFLRWLSGELTVLNDHMSIGCDYASMESLRAFAQAMTATGCDHLNKIEVKEVKHYRASVLEANEAAVSFFDGFWRSDGRDLALLCAGLSHGQVSTSLKSFSELAVVVCRGPDD